MREHWNGSSSRQMRTITMKQYVAKKCFLLYFSLLVIFMRRGNRSLQSGALFSGSAGKGNRRKQSARWQVSSISEIRVT